jgi:hypothetical protein
MEETTVTLPGIDLGADPGTFTAELSRPNGADDEYPSNNSMTVNYERPRSFEGRITLTLRTDDYANLPDVTNGIAYEVIDAHGQRLRYRDGFDDNITMVDTFDLPTGCYYFVIYDLVVGDGLLPIQGTAGSFSLRDVVRRTIYNANAGAPFLASFGDREIIPFMVTNTSSVEDEQALADSEVRIFPNPTSGSVTVDVTKLNRRADATIHVFTINGKKVLTEPMPLGRDTMSVDLSAQPAGIYMVLIDIDGQAWSETVVVQ